MNVGQRIQDRRKALKMSVEDLANKIGKSRATVYRYENGDIEKLPLDVLMPIAKALHVKPEYLMDWEEDDENNKQEEYYLDPEAARLAQKLFDDPNIHALLDAAEDSKPENIAMVADLLNRLKGTNIDG